MPRKTSRQKQQQVPVVVVAGGAGFVGSHLCESLLKSGLYVIAVDDFVTGSLANLESIKRHSQFELIEWNINQGIPPGLLERPVHYVVQATSVETHIGDDVLTLTSLLSESFGTKYLLDLAVGTGSRFILLSSLYIYQGLASSVSLDHYFGSSSEQAAVYSKHESWRYAEALSEAYARQYGLDVRVARIGDVYGPRMDVACGTLLADMIGQTLAGQDLEVDEEGAQEVLLTYVDDIVYGLNRLMFAEGEQFERSIYPLYNPEKVSVMSLAYTLRNYLPPGKEVRFTPGKSGSQFDLPRVEIDRTKQDLDWEPSVGITEGLKATIEAFRSAGPPPKPHQVTKEQLATLPQSQPPTPQPDKQPEPSQSQPEIAAPWNHKLPYRSSADNRSDSKAPVANEPKQEHAEPQPAAKPPPMPSQPEAKVSVRPKRWWQKWLLASILLLCYLGIGRPMLHTTTHAAAGAINVRQGVGQAQQFAFDQAAQQFESAAFHLSRAQVSMQGLGWLAGLSGQRDTFVQLDRGLLAMSSASQGLATTSSSLQPVLDQFKQLSQFRQHSMPTDNLEQLASQTATGLGQAQHQLGQAISYLTSSHDSVAGATISPEGEVIGQGLLTGQLGRVRSLLLEAQTALVTAEQAVTFLPDLLGASGTKRYLVMLQNSNELRPTGGFMGSFAELEIDHGVIRTFRVDDIYNPEGQLQSGLPMPTPFVDAFHVSEQTLRDANWSPDASVSAQLVAKLYQQATGRHVDGVAFVTLHAIRPILEHLGAMTVAPYPEPITADNFDTLAQVHSDVGFTPGSTAKRDFLGRLAEAIISKLEQGDMHVWAQLGRGVVAGLAQKEVQLYAENSQIQGFIDSQGWSGRMMASAGDYLRVVDANMAANKSNHYITRQTEYDINVDRQRQLRGVVKVTWTHQGQSGTWPGGDYRNYVRIYIPKQSRLDQAHHFDGEIDVYEEEDKTVVAGFVTIPYSSQKSVEIRYDLPETLGLAAQNGAYQLTWQKQAGIVDERVQVSFYAPIFLAFDLTSPEATISDGHASWHWIGDGDKVIEAQLASTAL